ncbi:MAG: glucose-1-phosphate cytidylyltransferase [Bacteriovoracaceae bacterium]|nr:glucose-1-phosphate cytidylyltransferase [Bacteriovoracaceae bacterium]
MKTVLLCGGFGTRLSEETTLKPKPMVEIGDNPIVWHIMNSYAKHGFNDFLLCLGYKGEVLRNYFLNFFAFNSDFKINLKSGKVDFLKECSIDWDVSLVDTGLNTMTGGRLARLKPILENEDLFMLSYGDGVSDVDISKLVEFHRSHGKIATVTAVRPPSRFGQLVINGDQVTSFSEKPQTGEGWINGGFFVFSGKVFDYLEARDSLVLEKEPLERLANEGELMTFKHEGFWQCMDTLRDKKFLTALWEDGDAPWGNN